MTVAAVATPVSYLASGSQATYVFPWKVVNLVDLIVQITIPGSNPVTQSSSTYSVAGLGNPNGGTVTFNAGNVTAGYTVTFFLNPQEVQNTDLQNQGSYNPSLVEGALDQITRMVQALQSISGQSIRGQIPYTVNMQLPSQALRAGQLLGFDTTGAVTLSGMSILLQQSTAVATVAALRSYAGATTNGMIVATGGYSSQADGGQAFYVWNSVDTRADNGGTILQISGVTTGRWNLLYSNAVSVRWFGAKGDGATDDHVAIQAAITWAVANGCGVVIPAGTYNHSVTIHMGFSYLEVIGIGNPTLHFTGAGDCVDLNYLTNPLWQVKLSNFNINGNASATNGLHLISANHCDISNITITNISNAALLINFSVSSRFSHIICSNNESTFTTVPAYGIYLDLQGAGNLVSNCVFIDMMMEGFPGTGLYLANAQTNLFIGGTFEGCNVGINVVVGPCNTFMNIDLEANAVANLIVTSNYNTFIGMLCASAGPSSGYNIELNSGASGNSFLGGLLTSVLANTGSSLSTFFGCTILTNITGVNTLWALYNCRTTGGALIQDLPGDTYAAWTPTLIGSSTAGSQTYGAVAGQYLNVGRALHVNGSVTISAKDGAMAGSVQIGGFPARCNAIAGCALVVAEMDGVTLPGGGTFLTLEMAAGANVATLMSNISGSPATPVLVANIASATTIKFSGTIITG